MHGKPALLPSNAPEASCNNCDTPLTGPYCAQCGQHAHESARSLRVLFHDAWHLITHFDGRLWATLAPLLARPGVLTREYFADRRARYVPPFRLYFIMSLIFFGVATLTTHHREPLVVNAPKLSAAELAEVQREVAEAETEAPGLGQHFNVGAAGVHVGIRADDCDQLHVSSSWLTQGLRTACRRQLGR